VSYVPIYLPDGSLGVDWFVTEDKRLEGVERVSCGWVAREVGPRRDVGFVSKAGFARAVVVDSRTFQAPLPRPPEDRRPLGR
jgi:hypothetical protein